MGAEEVLREGVYVEDGIILWLLHGSLLALGYLSS